MDVSGSPHRGVLSADDMARWQPTVEAPLTYDYGRYTVCKAGVWSQGPVMLQQLALLKGFELDGLDPAGPEFIHLQIECAKLAFADREKFYGDPKFSEIPIATLLSDAYNDERRKLISSDKASLDFRPGSVEGFGGGRQTAPRRRASRGGRRAGRRRADRRALRRGARRHRAFRHHRQGRQHGLVDAVGRLAAILAGHSRARLLPRQPRADVLAGGKSSGRAGAGQAAAHHAVARPWRCATASPIWPGARPAATSRINGSRNSSCGTSIATSICRKRSTRPAWHSEHFPISFWPRTARPGVLVVENRVPKATIENLRERGHIVEVGPDWSEGRLTAASRVGRRRRAAANPRGMQGYAAGR